MFLKTAISFTRCLFSFIIEKEYNQKKPGLKVNDQVDTYATTFLPVHLKNQVWSHQQGLKVEEQMQTNDLLNRQCLLTQPYSDRKCETQMLQTIIKNIKVDTSQQVTN